MSRLPSLLLSLLVLVSCARRPPVTSGPSELVAEGVRVARLAPAALPPGPALSGRRGDFLIESDRVRAIVGGGGEGAEASAMHGAILDVTGVEWRADLLRELRVVARSGSSDLPLAVERVEPLGGRGAPRLVIVHRGRGSASGLELRTELSAERGRPWLEVVTRAKNTGRASLSRFRVGDRMRWLREAPFVPGSGAMQRGPRQLANWFAMSSSRQSYAVVFLGGPAELSFLALDDSAEQLALAPEVELVAGGEVVHKRAIVVAEGGLSAVAEHAFTLTHQKIGRVAGRLEPPPAWARLEARSQADELMLTVDVGADGAFDFALPEGSWRLVLRAPGGRDETRVSVTAGAVARPELIVPTAARLAYRVTDTENRPLAARLVVRGVPPTPDPDLGPPHQASGAKLETYTADGTGNLPLPAGRYEILVTHGIEYTFDRQTVELGAESGTTLRSRLVRAVDTPGMIACDFHLHANPSGDSNVPLADRVISLLAEGVELAVATDHNHVTDYAPSVEALGARARLATVRGVEITTQRWGHFNAFPLPEGASPPPYDIAPIAIFEAVRSAAPAAVIQVNHPRMPHDIGYFSVGGLGADAGPAEGFSFDFDTIEVFNGFDLSNLPVVEKNIEEWFSLLASGRRYTAVGNSDSHDLARQHAGYPRTYVRVSDDRPEAARPELVAEALKAGRAFVTSGPIVDLVVGGGRPGDLVRAGEGGRVAMDVSVRAAPWIDVTRLSVVVSGRPRHEQAIAPSEKPERHRLHVELSLAEDAWIVAVVRGEKPLPTLLPAARSQPLAFTNPVYVDVDGDGAFGARR